ncbi:unnamed protein product [Choristocarpus tenellus]
MASCPGAVTARQAYRAARGWAGSSAVLQGRPPMVTDTSDKEQGRERLGRLVGLGDGCDLRGALIDRPRVGGKLEANDHRLLIAGTLVVADSVTRNPQFTQPSRGYITAIGEGQKTPPQIWSDGSVTMGVSASRMALSSSYTPRSGRVEGHGARRRGPLASVNRVLGRMPQEAEKGHVQLGRPRYQAKNKSLEPLMNTAIRASTVRVALKGEDGASTSSILPLKAALALAKKSNMDLVLSETACSPTFLILFFFNTVTQL